MHPEMPGFDIVSRHAKTSFRCGAQFVEQMGVNADARGDREIVRTRFAVWIKIRDATQSNSPRDRVQCGPGCAHRIEGYTQIVGQGIGRAHGQNCECSGSACQSLQNVVYSSVAATGKDGIAALRDSLQRLLGGVLRRTNRYQFGLNPGCFEPGQGSVQLGLTPRPAATGDRVVEQASLAHAPGSQMDCSLIIPN